MISFGFLVTATNFPCTFGAREAGPDLGPDLGLGSGPDLGQIRAQIWATFCHRFFKNNLQKRRFFNDVEQTKIFFLTAKSSIWARFWPFLGSSVAYLFFRFHFCNGWQKVTANRAQSGWQKVPANRAQRGAAPQAPRRAAVTRNLNEII